MAQCFGLEVCPAFARPPVLLFLWRVKISVPLAQANIIINPTFDSSITSDPNAAAIVATIEGAITMYEADITTPITVNITYER